jgi:chromosome segregation ATPase
MSHDADDTAELQRKLAGALRALDQEREQGDRAASERDSLRRELAALRQQYDGEMQAHASTRQGHDLLASRLAGLEAEASELRREASRQTQRAEAARGDLEAMRRDLIREQAAHHVTQERLAGLEPAQRSTLAELATEREAAAATRDRLRRIEGEYAALQQRVAGDQAAALAASERCEALTRDAGNLADRLTLLRRQLQDETEAHAATRRELAEQRAAAVEADRKRRGQGIMGAVGGAAALGLGLILRRR